MDFGTHIIGLKKVLQFFLYIDWGRTVRGSWFDLFRLLLDLVHSAHMVQCYSLLFRIAALSWSHAIQVGGTTIKLIIIIKHENCFSYNSHRLKVPKLSYFGYSMLVSSEFQACPSFILKRYLTCSPMDPKRSWICGQAKNKGWSDHIDSCPKHAKR